VTLFSGSIRALETREEARFMGRAWEQSPLAVAARQVLSPVSMPVAVASQGAKAALLAPEIASKPVDYYAGADWRYKRLYPDTGDDIAVIIANGGYTQHGGGIPDDAPAQADAEAFAVFAREALGIKPGNILWLRNATQAQFLRVFGSAEQPRGQLHDWIKPGRSRVVVYYAGHGAPHTDRDSFLVPVDADAGRLSLNGYALSTLYGNLGRLQARSVWVVLESCFSGVAQSGLIVSQASPVFTRPSGLHPPKGVTVISAARHDQIASWSPDGSHSLFTRHFLEGMSGKADAAPFGNGDGGVDWQELERYLKDSLTYWARRYYGRDQMAVIQAEVR
jgi:hypothetical protein